MLSSSEQPFVLAVAITKGGTGKTTTAAALAVELASFGHAVVAVDVDTQGQLGLALGARAGRTADLASVLSGTSTVTEALVQVRHGVYGSGPVWLLRGSPALATEAARMASDMATGMLAIQDAAVEAARLVGAPFVIIDTPPGWGPLSLGSLSAAEAVLTPLPPHALAVEALSTFDRHLSSVQRTRERFGGRALPRLAFVLPTLVAPRGIAPSLALESLRAWSASHRDGPEVLPSVSRSVRVEEAPARGLAMTEHAPDHAASSAYRAAAAAVQALALGDDWHQHTSAPEHEALV